MTPGPDQIFFELLDSGQLECVGEIQLTAGEVLIHEGETDDSFYVIAEGEMEVWKAFGTPEERLIGLRQRGDFLGETILLDPQAKRTASIRARTAARLYKVTDEDINLLLPKHPTLVYEIARRLSLRLRESDDATIRDLQEKNQQLALAYADLKAAQTQIIEKERLEKELQVARNIQLSILPSRLPGLAGYTFGACMQAARAVGGDLYDLMALDEDHIGIFIGDVSDKGVPAAIFMALVRSLVRATASTGMPPIQVLREVNRHLSDMNAADMFVTVIYGVFEGSTRKFHYARGGHELPIIFTGDGIQVPVAMATGMLLGMFSDPILDEQTVSLPPNGILLLYTDGAFDAENALAEQFGRSRLEQAVQKAVGLPAQRACDTILASIVKFQGSAQQADDITLVAIQG